jgi:hypothetical protein
MQYDSVVALSHSMAESKRKVVCAMSDRCSTVYDKRMNFQQWCQKPKHHALRLALRNIQHHVVIGASTVIRPSQLNYYLYRTYYSPFSLRNMPTDGGTGFTVRQWEQFRAIRCCTWGTRIEEGDTKSSVKVTPRRLCLNKPWRNFSRAGHWFSKIEVSVSNHCSCFNTETKTIKQIVQSSVWRTKRSKSD